MQHYNLTIEDSVADKVLAFLNGFSKTQVKVVENKELENHAVSESTLLSLEELYGSLKPYMNGHLSDEEMENAIAQGAIDSGMAGKNG